MPTCTPRRLSWSLTWCPQVGVIENEFRVPQFELIAGDPCLEVRMAVLV